jgi:hypothetical protein
MNATLIDYINTLNRNSKDGPPKNFPNDVENPYFEINNIFITACVYYKNYKKKWDEEKLAANLAASLTTTFAEMTPANRAAHAKQSYTRTVKSGRENGKTRTVKPYVGGRKTKKLNKFKTRRNKRKNRKQTRRH